MGLRIKGQDVVVDVIKNGAVVNSVVNVRNFEMELLMETIEEEYLGQTTKAYDDIYNGASCTMSCHPENDGIFDLLDAIKARAQRRTPGVKFNVKATLAFPGGDRVRVVFPDVSWSGGGIGFSDRKSYGTTNLGFKVSDYQRIA